MKSSLFSKLIFATLIFTLATGAFAASNSHKHNFALFAPAQVNGVQIPAGEYTARWEGPGPNVQVSILQGNKVVATVPAQLVPLSKNSADTRTEVTNGSNGSRELTSLQFAGKKFSLQLGAETAKGQTKSDSTN
ncbi:MAG TPA: hypothetical protein VGJ33_13480 [Candidatus Angelobacter sp.]